VISLYEIHEFKVGHDYLAQDARLGWVVLRWSGFKKGWKINPLLCTEHKVESPTILKVFELPVIQGA